MGQEFRQERQNENYRKKKGRVRRDTFQLPRKQRTGKATSHVAIHK